MQQCLDSINSAVAEINIKNLKLPEQGCIFGLTTRITVGDHHYVEKNKKLKGKKK
jgi:hypothetical protein